MCNVYADLNSNQISKKIKELFSLLIDVASRNEMFIYRRINGDVLGDWSSAITHYGYDSGSSISADGYHVYQWDLFVLHERYYNDVSGQFGNCSGYRKLRLTHASGTTHYQDYWLQSSKVFYTFYILDITKVYTLKVFPSLFI